MSTIKLKSSVNVKDKEKDRDKKLDKEKDKEKEKKSTMKLKDKEKDKEKAKKTSEIDLSDNMSTSNINQNNKNQIINQEHVEKCEGCYFNEGYVYCTNCEKTYCKKCEEQLHIIPRMKTHNRIPVGQMYNLKKLCYNHGNKLNLYCETCEEPICNDCFNLGPHNSRLHRVVNLVDSFRKKFNVMKMIIKSSLKKRYELYLDQLQFLDFNIEEIKSNKNILDKNIQQEYLTMIDRLKAQEGKKLAILNYESSLIQKEINKIHDICNFVHDNNMQNSPDMLEFLIKFKKSKDLIEAMLAKPIKSKKILIIKIYLIIIDDIDINTNEFINELEEKRTKLIKYDKSNEILQMKDDIIWNMMQEKKNQEEKELAIIKDKARNEISEWSKLTEKYSTQLEKYTLVCHFCGNFLDSETINTNCLSNSGISDYVNKQKFTDENISSELYNTRRHFFGKPALDYYDKMNNIVVNAHINHKLNDERVHQEQLQLEEINALEAIEKKEKESKGNLNKKNQFTNNVIGNNKLININNNNNSDKERFNRLSNLDINGIKEKIRFFAGAQKIDIEKMMSDFFKGRNTTSFDELKLLLMTKFELSENECNRFLGQIVSTPPTIGIKNPYSSSFSQGFLKDKLGFGDNLTGGIGGSGHEEINNKKKDDYYNTHSNFNNVIGNNQVNNQKEAFSNNFTHNSKNININSSSSPYSQQNTQDNNLNINNNVLLEDFLLLLRRSDDFPKRNKNNNYENEINETPFERERRLLNNYNIKKLQQQQKDGLFQPEKNKNNIIGNQGIISDLVLKILSNIQLFNVNFYQLLSEFDNTGKGFITKENFVKALEQFNIKLTLQELNSLLVYFKISNPREINVQEISAKLMNESVLLQQREI